MSAEAAFFLVGARRHDELLSTLFDLEQVGRDHPGAQYPAQAIELQAAVWEFLKAYGRRGEDGQVDEKLPSGIVAWRPSAAQLEAHTAGLPVPPDEVRQ